MERRTFLKGLLTLSGSTAVEEIIPFNRVWFFPKKIEIIKDLNVIKEVEQVSRNVVRGSFARLMAPGLHEVFLQWIKETDEARYKNIFNLGYTEVK